MMMATTPNFDKEIPFTETKPQAMSALSSVFDRCIKTLLGAFHPRTFPETGDAGNDSAHAVHVLSSVEEDVDVKDNEENKENIPPSPPKKTVSFSPDFDPFRTPPRRFASSSTHSTRSPPPIRRMPGFCFERAQYAPGIPILPMFSNSPASELAIKSVAASAGCKPTALRSA